MQTTTTQTETTAQQQLISNLIVETIGHSAQPPPVPLQTQQSQTLPAQQQPQKRKLRFIYGDDSIRRSTGSAHIDKAKIKVKESHHDDDDDDNKKAITAVTTSKASNDLIKYDKLNKENYITREIEVECEIEEDPSFIEGSEDYVRTLIKKVQTQYKDPETVHIKIIRRQKQTVWDSFRNAKRSKKSVDKQKLQQEQLIKKEYYTLRSSSQPPFTSSFINTADIPYIDDELSSNDSRSNSLRVTSSSGNANSTTSRNARSLLETKELVNNKDKLNYFIENHIIFSGDSQFSSNKGGDANTGYDNVDFLSSNNNSDPHSSLRDFVKSIGGKLVIRVDDSHDGTTTPAKHSDQQTSKKGPVGDLLSSIGGTIKVDKPSTVEVSQQNVLVADESAVVNIKGPHIDRLDISEDSAVDINGGVKGFFKGIGGKVKTPETQSPEVSVKVKTPKVEKSKIKSGKIELKAPKVDIELPVVSASSVDVSVPSVHIEGDIKAPGLDVSLQEPSLPQVEIPPVDVDAELKGGIKGFFKGIGGKVKTPDLPAPEVKVKTPKIKSSKSPSLKVELPKVDVKTPSVKVEVPNIDIPSVLEVEMPSVHVDTTPVDLDLSVPDFPNVDINRERPDIEPPNLNVTLPATIIETPTYDISIDAPKLEPLSVHFDPTLDTNIKAPSAKLPEVDVNADLKGGVKGFFKGIGGKVKTPELPVHEVKIKTPKIKSPKVPKVDLKAPSVEVHLPQASHHDTNLPSVDVSVKEPRLPGVNLDESLPSVDVSLQGPSIQIPDIDVNADLKGGVKGFFKGIGGKVKTPEIPVPEIKVKTPKTPKIKSPKSPKVNVELPKVDVKTPSVQVDLPQVKAPELDLDVSLPSTSVSIESPRLLEADVTLPSVDVQASSVDVNIEAPKVELPSVDIQAPSASLTTVDLNTELKGGLAGFFKGIGGKVKTPEIPIPEVKVKTPKIKSPKSPKVKVEVPKMEIKAPEIPKVEVQIPNLSVESDIAAPKVDLDLSLPSAEIEIQKPSLEMPSVDIQGPSVDVNVQAPSVAVPSVDLNAELKGGLAGFFKGIGGKVKTPEIPIPEVKVKTPKIKPPKTSKVEVKVAPVVIPKVEAPTIDISMQSPSVPQVESPEIDINTELKGGVKGFFKGIGGKVKTPESEIKVKTPTLVKFEAKMQKPEVTFETVDVPSILEFNEPIVIIDRSIHIQQPNLDIQPLSVDVKLDAEPPLVDVNVVEVEIESPKFPTVHIANEQQIKTELPEAYIGTRLPGVDMDVYKPRLKGPSVDLPDIEIKERLISSLESADFEKNVQETLELAQRYFAANSENQSNNDFFGDVVGHINITGLDRIGEPGDQVTISKLHITESSVSGGQTEVNITDIEVNNGNLIESVNRRLSGEYNSSNVNNNLNLGSIEIVPSEKITIEIHEKTVVDASGNTRHEIEKSVIKTKENPGDHTIVMDSTTSKTVEVSPSKTGTGSKKSLKNLFSSSSETTAKKSTLEAPPQTEASVKASTSTKKEKPPKKIKIDYSQPRKTKLDLLPNFDGLGIHISCDPATRKSPYIHHIEQNSPGAKGNLKKGDYILEINGEDAVNMDFDYVINNIKSHMEQNDLIVTVGNQKVYKKWVKAMKKTGARAGLPEKSSKKKN